VLDLSTIGPLVLDMARVEGSLSGREADITSSSQGSDAHGNRQRRVALGDPASRT
jgi:hypothetical protein